MKVVYFAWVRERVGEPFEMVETGDAKTVADVVEQLSEMSEAHALALSDREVLRFALDQKLVEIDSPLNGACELAIFPPMTGG